MAYQPKRKSTRRAAPARRSNGGSGRSRARGPARGSNRKSGRSRPAQQTVRIVLQQAPAAMSTTSNHGVTSGERLGRAKF